MRIISLLFLVSFSCFIVKAEESVSFYKPAVVQFNRLTDDTLDVFIKQYGKDSLLRKIDQHIYKSKELLKAYNRYNSDVELALKFNGVNKHFNLGLDSFIMIDENQIQKNFTKSYGKIIGDTAFVKASAAEIDKKNIYNLFLQSMYTKQGRSGLAVFCNEFVITDKMLDTLYKSFDYYSKSIQLEYYWTFVEFNRDCGNKENNSAAYKTQIYNKLNKVYSISKIATDTAAIIPKNMVERSLSNSIEFFALGLYGKDITLKKNAKDIVYFLSLQLSDGGWQEYNANGQYAKFKPTFYGLWALLELREEIRKL
ncbi:MAG: hypothetical protein IPM95_02480 [Sphingobacteriales bacterium]|nr:hypothetical protein [Sphingobacteriales bacterium]